MKKYIFLIILGVVNIHIYAQNKSITDSIHTISEIEIVAKKQKKAEIGKLNLPLQYIPLSVSTVSAKNLEMRGMSNFYQILVCELLTEHTNSLRSEGLIILPL